MTGAGGSDVFATSTISTESVVVWISGSTVSIDETSTAPTVDDEIGSDVVETELGARVEVDVESIVELAKLFISAGTVVVVSIEISSSTDAGVDTKTGSSSSVM